MTTQFGRGPLARPATLGSRSAVVQSATVFARDVGQGLLEVSHNSLALVGLLIVGLPWRNT